MPARFVVETPKVVCHLDGRIERAEVEELCDRARPYLEGDPDVEFVCDVRDLGAPNLTAVDALARLQLIARRRGKEIHLRHPRPALVELLALVGLAGCVLEAPS